MTKHGESKTRLYRIYNGMKQRCNNPNASGYEYYGAKGVGVCEEWSNDFLAFKKWAYENGYSDTLTIDRIDPKGDYCPNNCRWLTLSENAALSKFSKNQASYLKALEGSIKYSKYYTEYKETSQRISQIENIIKRLPDLSHYQLELISDYIEWLDISAKCTERHQLLTKDEEHEYLQRWTHPYREEKEKNNEKVF